MSQAAVILPGSPLTGAAAAADMNAAWAAMISKFSGNSAPTLGPGASSALVVGQWWYDTSVTPNVLRIYDGTNWVPFQAISAAAAPHLAAPMSGHPFLAGFADSVNFNSVADTQINLILPSTNYMLEGVWVQNTGTTASLTTAKYGLFSASAGGGTALVASNTVLTALTSNAVNTAGSAALVSTANIGAFNFNPLFFRITTAQGAAATGNVYITARALP